jgi:hypothetical protein
MSVVIEALRSVRVRSFTGVARFKHDAYSAEPARPKKRHTYGFAAAIGCKIALSRAEFIAPPSA